MNHTNGSISTNEVDIAPSFFSAKSGLMVNALDDEWVILPNKGKGAQVSVGWVHASDMSGT